MNQIKRQIRWYAPDQEDPITKKEFKALEPEGQAALVAAIRRYKNGDSAIVPKQIDSDIYEIRVQVGNNHFRALMFKDSPVHYVIVRVFFKNTQKTPSNHLKTARSRMKRWKAKNSRSLIS